MNQSILLAAVLLLPSACSPGPGPTGVQYIPVREITIRYSVLEAAPKGPFASRVLSISDAATVEELWKALRVESRSDACCACDVRNGLTLSFKDGREERWHFCHRPTVIGVKGGLWTATPAFYEAIRRELATRESGRVGLICHNEDLGN